MILFRSLRVCLGLTIAVAVSSLQPRSSRAETQPSAENIIQKALARAQQTDNDSSLRQLLGQPKSATGDKRESFLTPDLVAHFDFRLLDETRLNDRPAYRIAFQPKASPVAGHRMVDRLLDRISGTLWIDSAEFEVARVDVRLGSEVDILGGMVGCLKKLAYTMIRTRVADGVWLNSFSSADLEGRKLLDSLRIKTKSQSSNFRPLQMNW